jgi:hypothetical protein
MPKPEEVSLALGHLKKAKSRREGAEDVAWALINTREFQFNH